MISLLLGMAANPAFSGAEMGRFPIMFVAPLTEASRSRLQYPTMLKGAGITDINTQLLYNGVQNILSFGGALTGAFFTDRWGRRKQLMISTLLFVVFFTMILALNATNLIENPDRTSEDKMISKSNDQARAIIAIIFLFGFVYGVGYTPLQALYPVEVLSYESRAKGYLIAHPVRQGLT
jgi:MFS family permease